jgi:uncharacterized GH25 family protein
MLKVAVQLVSVFILWCAVPHAFAHDIWLAPEHYHPAKGDTLVVHQWAGAELDTELELALLKHLTPRFELITPHGTINLLKSLPDEEVKPVLNRVLDFEGTALLTMEHDFFLTALPNETFSEYLTHEEFEGDILTAYRAHMGQRAKQRERFSRAFKCLIQIGDTPDGDAYKHLLGQQIEIILHQNPYQLTPGDTLDVTVRFENEPLPNTLVKAFNKNGAGTIAESKARTNEAGVARFTLDKPGLWLLRLVQLRPCQERSAGECEEIDWESYWTSYTFQLD